MFRKEALRKGALKTINARTGRMVGMNVPGGAIDYVQKGGGFYDPKTGRLVGGLPVDPKSTNAPKPGIFQRIKSDIRNFPGGIKSDPIGTIKGTRPFGLGGGISRLLGFEGIYSAVDPYVGQYIQNPYGRMAASTGLSMLGAMNPYIRGAGVVKSVYDMGKAGLSKFNKDTAEYRAKPIGEKTSFSRMGDDEAGVFIPSIEQQVESDKKIVQGKPGGRVGFENRNKTLKAEGDPLLQDNVANSDDVANLDAVQENSLGGETPPGNEDGITNYENTIQEDKERREAEKLLTVEEKKKIKKQNEAVGTNEIVIGGPTDDPDFNKTIALAKQYEEAVYKGEGSQAGLIFLANLASGLLTGTTRRRGLGGAMEVFGQAIGPAVNNYVTIKLKEGELRQNRRAKSLEAAMDHMKFLNDAARVERPDVTAGVVQIRGADGDLQNYNGYIGKDGTTYLPGGLGQDGRQSLSPIAQGGILKDSGPDGVLGTEDDIPLGRFEKFLKQDKISSRLSDIEDTLGNRYTAYSVTLDILDTIKQTDAEGNLVSPGVGLTLDTYLRRIGNAAADLVGRDIVAENLKVAQSTLESLYEDEVAIINKDPDLSEKEKENAIAMIDKDKLKDQLLKDKKGVGWFSGLSAKDQEKLAVQETSLVYALANTFKDQDRLTQRDINAAREIVNLFAIGRGGQDVRDSIEAIAGQLRADIRRQELLYTSSGGLYSTIQDLKELEGYDSSKAQEKVEEAFGLTKEQIKNELGKMEL